MNPAKSNDRRLTDLHARKKRLEADRQNLRQTMVLLHKQEETNRVRRAEYESTATTAFQAAREETGIANLKGMKRCELDFKSIADQKAILARQLTAIERELEVVECEVLQFEQANHEAGLAALLQPLYHPPKPAMAVAAIMPDENTEIFIRRKALKEQNFRLARKISAVDQNQAALQRRSADLDAQEAQVAEREKQLAIDVQEILTRGDQFRQEAREFERKAAEFEDNRKAFEEVRQTVMNRPDLLIGHLRELLSDEKQAMVLHGALDEQVARHQTLEKERSRLQKQIAKTDRENKKLAEEVEFSRQNLTSLQDNSHRLQREHEAATRKVDRQKEERTLLQEETDKLAAADAANAMELESLHGRRNSLRDSVDARQRLLEQLSDEVERLAEQDDSLRVKAERILKEFSSK